MFRFGKKSLLSVGLITFLCLMVVAGCASNQPAAKEVKYPVENITITVGFLAGGSADATARTAAEFMTKKFGKTVLVVNKPGSNGSLAATEVVKTKPDGYNLLLASGGNMTIMPNNTNTGYTLKDFTPIAQLTDAPCALVVSKDFPAKNLKEFIEYAKKNKGKLRFGTPGSLGTQQLATKKLSDLEGLDLQNIPFNGAPAAIAAMLGGHVEAVNVMSSDLMGQAPLLRVLAVFGPKRDSAFPDAPTLEELGYKDFDFSVWYGIVGPKGMPDSVVKTLGEALAGAAKDPDVLAKWKKMNLTPAYLEAKSFGERMNRLSIQFKQMLDAIKAETATKK